jgi:uncharacterized metal-binding protein
MPSGKTHDLVTLFIAAPTFFASYFYTKDITLSLLVTAGTLFGGLMFGPDLDINSNQYQRWGPLRICWWPYRVAFSHRSRFSHGIFLGTVIRIIYFIAVVGLLVALGLYVYEVWQGGAPRSGDVIIIAARRVLDLLRKVDRAQLLATFIGLWWGSASHTILDLTVTTIKQLFKIF